MAWREQRTRSRCLLGTVFPQRETRGQETVVGFNSRAKVLATRRSQSWSDYGRLEGTLRLSQLPPFTCDGARETEGRSQNCAGLAAS